MKTTRKTRLFEIKIPRLLCWGHSPLIGERANAHINNCGKKKKKEVLGQDLQPDTDTTESYFDGK